MLVGRNSLGIFSYTNLDLYLISNLNEKIETEYNQYERWRS